MHTQPKAWRNWLKKTINRKRGLSGDTVNTGSRMELHAQGNAIQITEDASQMILYMNRAA
jgi:hypothetical protein